MILPRVAAVLATGILGLALTGCKSEPAVEDVSIHGCDAFVAAECEMIIAQAQASLQWPGGTSVLVVKDDLCPARCPAAVYQRSLLVASAAWVTASLPDGSRSGVHVVHLKSGEWQLTPYEP